MQRRTTIRRQYSKMLRPMHEFQMDFVYLQLSEEETRIDYERALKETPAQNLTPLGLRASGFGVYGLDFRVW